MLKCKFRFIKHGFTIIELIVIMAVMAILVFLGSLGYKGYTRQAQLTRLQYDARLLSDACQRYYVNNGDYPRLADTPYTSDQANAFAAKVYDQKGAVIILDSGGSYYDLDFSKLKMYVSVNEDYKNFILQNPAGDIYFLEPSSNIRLPGSASLKPVAPTLTVDAINNPPVYNVVYPTGVTPQETEYQLDGGTIVTSAPVDLLSTGSHNIKVRYKYNNNYSDWVSADFTIVNGVKQFSTGADFTVALMRDGTVKAWGRNLYGQLGTSINSKTNNPNPIPTTVSGLSDVKQISAGNGFVLALMQDGTVKSWGLNHYGQLGIDTNSGTANPNPTPTTVSGLTGVKQIEAGGYHATALMQNGTVMAWGYNLYGQLGISTNSGTANPNPTPTMIPELSGVAQLSLNVSHTVALLQDGTVKTWGFNRFGQLGISTNSGTSNPNPTPTIVSGLTGAKQVVAGNGYTVVLMQDGTVKTCGYNGYGQLGISTNSGTANPYPILTMVPGLTGVVQISAGFYHTIAVMQDGTIKAWGYNEYGQLGYNSNIGTTNPNSTPITVPGLTGAEQILAGSNHTVAVLKNGTVKAWGYNRFGQLGISTNSGTENPNPTPTAVSGL